MAKKSRKETRQEKLQQFLRDVDELSTENQTHKETYARLHQEEDDKLEAELKRLGIGVRNEID